MDGGMDALAMDSFQSRAAHQSFHPQTQGRDGVKRTQHGQANATVCRQFPHSPALPKAAYTPRSTELAPNDTLGSLRNSSWRCQQMSARDNKTQSGASQQSVNLGLRPRGIRTISSPVASPSRPGAVTCSHIPAAFCWRDPLPKPSWNEGNCRDAKTRPPGERGNCPAGHRSIR